MVCLLTHSLTHSFARRTQVVLPSSQQFPLNRLCLFLCLALKHTHTEVFTNGLRVHKSLLSPSSSSYLFPVGLSLFFTLHLARSHTHRQMHLPLLPLLRNPNPSLPSSSSHNARIQHIAPDEPLPNALTHGSGITGKLMRRGAVDNGPCGKAKAAGSVSVCEKVERARGSLTHPQDG